MPSLDLTQQEARALALRAQGFGPRLARHPIDVLDSLAAIQLDSVNVLARSHQLVPFSRLGPYDPERMVGAIYHQRRGFEYWGHEASWLPVRLYRFFLHRMERHRQHGRRWRVLHSGLRSEHADLYPEVLERIRSEGALSAADFSDPRGKRGTWWDWKPAKVVLEDLFDQGYLMAAGRTRGFARIYDLPERVLPEGLDLRDPGPVAAVRHLFLVGAQSLGVGTPEEVADYFRLAPRDWRPVLPELLESGELAEVGVEGWDRRVVVPSFALEQELTMPRHRPVFLSPFDNLIWARSRVKRLFGMHYRVEIYVPGEQRRYGYYVLPLLVHGTLSGRADLKLDRPAGVLRVRALWLEGATPAQAARALLSLADHLGARQADLERVEPDSARGDLTRYLARGQHD